MLGAPLLYYAIPNSGAGILPATWGFQPQETRDRVGLNLDHSLIQTLFWLIRGGIKMKMKITIKNPISGLISAAVAGSTPRSS